jgi:hypothetical protein
MPMRLPQGDIDHCAGRPLKIELVHRHAASAFSRRNADNGLTGLKLGQERIDIGAAQLCADLELAQQLGTDRFGILCRFEQIPNARGDRVETEKGVLRSVHQYQFVT